MLSRMAQDLLLTEGQAVKCLVKEYRGVLDYVSDGGLLTADGAHNDNY